MQKTTRHWWKKSKTTQTNRERYHVLGLEVSILWKWLCYPKQYTNPMQSLLNYWFFTEIEQKKNHTICMETQKILNSQSNLEKEEWSCRNQPSWLLTILQSYTHRDSMILAQFSLVAQSCPTLCDPMNCSTPGLPVHHQLPEFTQTHVHRVGDAIHPAISSLVVPFSSCPQSLPASESFPMSQLSHEMAKVLEFQL